MGIFDWITGSQPYETEAAGYGTGEGYIQDATKAATGYLNPYLQAGTGALGQYQSQLGQMSDPTSFYNNIMSQYQDSPATQFQRQQGLNSLQNTAAATGYTGSGKELKDIDQFSQGVTAQGQNQFLQNILGIHNNFLQGLQGLTGMGQQAGTTMGGFQMQGAQDRAEEEAAKAQAEAQAQAQSSSWMANMIGSIF